MKKQGFNTFLWHMLARRLQQWARTASLHIGEDIYIVRQASASDASPASESDSFAPTLHVVDETDGQQIDSDLAPAHWLARIQSAAAPTSWLAHVGRDAPASLALKANPPRRPAVLSPEARSAHVHSSLAGGEGDHRSAEHETPPLPEESRRRQDDSSGDEPRGGLDVAAPAQASLARVFSADDHVPAPFAPQRGAVLPFSAVQAQVSGRSISALTEATTGPTYRLPEREGILTLSHEREEPSFAWQEKSLSAPLRDTTDASTPSTMATSSPLPPDPTYISSCFSVEARDNAFRTVEARAGTRLPLEERGAQWQRALGPQTDERPPGSPAVLALARAIAPAPFSASASLHQIIPAHQVDEHMQRENHWPALPERLPEEHEDWVMAQRAWERQQRLDREQRGSAWSV